MAPAVMSVVRKSPEPVSRPYCLSPKLTRLETDLKPMIPLPFGYPSGAEISAPGGWLGAPLNPVPLALPILSRMAGAGVKQHSVITVRFPSVATLNTSQHSGLFQVGEAASALEVDWKPSS